MTDDDLTIRFSTPQRPEEAFAAISDVRSWWVGDVTGDTDRIGGEFTYRHGTVHRSVQHVTELDPGRRVVWSVVDAHLDLVADPTEWVGTDICFDITPTTSGSEVVFTHHGLTSSRECFDSCSDAWQHYFATSLRNRIAGVAA